MYGYGELPYAGRRSRRKVPLLEFEPQVRKRPLNLSNMLCPPDPLAPGWWLDVWYEHQNLVFMDEQGVLWAFCPGENPAPPGRRYDAVEVRVEREALAHAFSRPRSVPYRVSVELPVMAPGTLDDLLQLPRVPEACDSLASCWSGGEVLAVLQPARRWAGKVDPTVRDLCLYSFSRAHLESLGACLQDLLTQPFTVYRCGGRTPGLY